MRVPGKQWLQVGVCLASLALPAVQASALVTLESALSIKETYTDNLFFTERNKEEDFATFVSPSVSLTYESRNVVLGGTYSGTFQIFANNSPRGAREGAARDR